MSYDWGRTMSEDKCGETCKRANLCYACSKELGGWQGLTDEEIHDCFQNRGRGSDGLKTRKMIAAAIEAMLKEKNGG